MNLQWKWLQSAILECTPEQCLEWPFRGRVYRRGGVYGRTNMGRQQILAHRAAYFFHNKRWPTPCCRHTCDNTLCVNPFHLVEGTQKDNMKDMVERGRSARGEDRPEAKMTEELVRQMRAEYIPGIYGCTRLSRKYGIHEKNCYNILNRRAWKHVL